VLATPDQRLAAKAVGSMSDSYHAKKRTVRRQDRRGNGSLYQTTQRLEGLGDSPSHTVAGSNGTTPISDPGSYYA
jgi:hypothetical protein